MAEDGKAPNHVGIIMDGNRRWAKANGVPSIQGHAKGVEVLRSITEHAAKSGVKFLSVYAFSTENWRRTEEEVGFLMGLFVKSLAKYLEELHQQNVRLVMLGSREGLSDSLLEAWDKAAEKTKNNTGITLATCWNYGGHQEIIDGFKLLSEQGLDVSKLTPETFEKFLYEGEEIPPVDYVIRTSGEQRTSGFMLWRAAYAEFYAVDKLWPEFSEVDFDVAMKEYSNRGRRFGQ